MEGPAVQPHLVRCVGASGHARFQNCHQSIDDRVGKAISMDKRKPWWMDDPEIRAFRERALEELQLGIDEDEPTVATNPIRLSQRSTVARPAERCRLRATIWLPPATDTKTPSLRPGD
jgi:hypothetical protein